MFLVVVAPKDITMAHVNKQIFKVNGKEFTEDEIIEAIKDYYPERLI